LPLLLRRSYLFLLIWNLYCSESRIMYTGSVGLHVQGNQDMLYLWWISMRVSGLRWSRTSLVIVSLVGSLVFTHNQRFLS
jgi:hypothetical protein